VCTRQWGAEGRTGSEGQREALPVSKEGRGRRSAGSRGSWQGYSGRVGTAGRDKPCARTESRGCELQHELSGSLAGYENETFLMSLCSSPLPWPLAPAAAVFRDTSPGAPSWKALHEKGPLAWALLCRPRSRSAPVSLCRPNAKNWTVKRSTCIVLTFEGLANPPLGYVPSTTYLGPSWSFTTTTIHLSRMARATLLATFRTREVLRGTRRHVAI